MNSRKTKFLLIISLMLILACVFVACKKNSDDNSETLTPESVAEVIETVFGGKENVKKVEVADDGTITATVSDKSTVFSLADLGLIDSDKTTYSISSDGTNKSEKGSVELTVGENTFYIVINTGDDEFKIKIVIVKEGTNPDTGDDNNNPGGDDNNDPGENTTVTSLLSADFPNFNFDSWVDSMVSGGIRFDVTVITIEDGEESPFFSQTDAKNGNKYFGIAEGVSYYYEVSDSEEYFDLYIKWGDEWTKRTAHYGGSYALTADCTLVFEEKDEAESNLEEYFRSVLAELPFFTVNNNGQPIFNDLETDRTDCGTYYEYVLLKSDVDEDTGETTDVKYTVKIEKTTARLLGYVIESEYDGVKYIESCVYTMPYEIVFPAAEEVEDDAIVEHEHVFGEWEESTPASCTNGGEETRRCECGETETRNTSPLGHNYGEESYEWSEDHTYCTAKRVCLRCTAEEEEVALCEQSTTATCTQAGTRTYTATFENTAFEEQVFTVSENAFGHTYGEASYEWANDHSSCTAKRYCLRCQSEDKEEAQISSSSTVTCTENGIKTYTATFTNDYFQTQYYYETDAFPGHTYGEASYDWAIDNSACTAKRTCSACGYQDKETAYTTSDTTATCTEGGIRTYYATFTNTAFENQTNEVAEIALGHNYVDGVCTVCGEHEVVNVPLYTRVDANGVENENGDYIYFGYYPQTKVTDETLISTLNSRASTNPASSNSKWVSYGYYSRNSQSTKYMWYIDMVEDGVKYRGVYFTNFRPWTTGLQAKTYYNESDGNSEILINGYFKETKYWFRYDPIKWRILSENDGEALVICDMVIDSQNYYKKIDETREDGAVYPNNYEYSDVRSWLNDVFYNVAFTDLQKELIMLTLIDNGAASTNPAENPTQFNGGNNGYACNDTYERIFLPSVKEATTSSYGYDPGHLANDEARRLTPTQYALIQGIHVETDESYAGNAAWWLRSPYYYGDSGNYVSYVKSNGSISMDDDAHMDVIYTNMGIVPVLRIRLTEDEPEEPYEHLNNYTYTRVDANGDEDADGNYIFLGMYPQTEVTDTELKATLTGLAGELPVYGDDKNWTSYEYYVSSSNLVDFMWYIDVQYENEEYRGVYFTRLKPYYTTASSSSHVKENGYEISTVYWFKYEPVKWRILTEENGKAFILSELILDCTEYYISSSNHDGGYANNYANSSIRKWLNDNFYNTAFNALQKQLISLTVVDNSERSTQTNGNASEPNSSNNYWCEDTEDYVFLLSEKEVTNTDYGFQAYYLTADSARIKKTTDYCRVQGSYSNTDSGYEENGYWWLRSPYYGSASKVTYVKYDGKADTIGQCYFSEAGVAPALWIDLQ